MRKDLDKIEKRLIEQEHRPWQVITNFFYRKKKWANDTGKQNAAKAALLWRILYSPTVIAVSGGLIAILTLLELKRQNTIIQEQNNYFKQQLSENALNKYESIYLSEEESVSRREKAVLDYLRTIRIVSKEGLVSLAGANLKGCTFKNENYLFRNVQFSDVKIDSLSFVDTDLTGSIFKDLKTLNDNNVWGFASCDLRDTYFDMTEFRDILFYNSYLQGSNLVNFATSSLAPVFIDSEKVYDSITKDPFYNNEGGKLPYRSQTLLNGRTIYKVGRDVRTESDLVKLQKSMINIVKRKRREFFIQNRDKLVSESEYDRLWKNHPNSKTIVPFDELLNKINLQLKIIRLSESPKRFTKN